ncbi:hypothetical protein D0N36_07520 [Hymenobacter lapidiphilus]|uniref:hypothetical protein n=1 Tax=Hymenobacter sp. CCM 8763 TaxID=2303334 RepID=UPI000E34CC58|nr:hypothetical protein [Hymenobacter sp. CCM 8763]RFP65771.1 hypothetical protein D0N36_07520 [Hymenobacter sp. CCM 8763]
MEENLSKSLIGATASNLTDITKDVIETLFDSILDDGFVKSIPVVNTVHSLYKMGLGIRERIFIKMLLKFLLELKNISIEERETFVIKLQEKEYGDDVGEKIIIILDKIDDSDKASMIGKLFSAYIRGKFEFEDFLRLSHIINNSFVGDIKMLPKYFSDEKAIWRLDDDFANKLNRIGLVSSKIKPDFIAKTNKERFSGSESHLDYVVSYSLNNDALIIVREVFDLEWIEKLYQTYSKNHKN